MPINTSTTTERWTAAELRRPAANERDAILKEAAALAEKDYRVDPELSGFEAFGKDDLHGDSSSAKRR